MAEMIKLQAQYSNQHKQLGEDAKKYEKEILRAQQEYTKVRCYKMLFDKAAADLKNFKKEYE